MALFNNGPANTGFCDKNTLRKTSMRTVVETAVTTLDNLHASLTLPGNAILESVHMSLATGTLTAQVGIFSASSGLGLRNLLNGSSSVALTTATSINLALVADFDKTIATLLANAGIIVNASDQFVITISPNAGTIAIGVSLYTAVRFAIAATTNNKNV